MVVAFYIQLQFMNCQKVCSGVQILIDLIYDAQHPVGSQLLRRTLVAPSAGGRAALHPQSLGQHKQWNQQNKQMLISDVKIFFRNS